MAKASPKPRAGRKSSQTNKNPEQQSTTNAQLSTGKKVEEVPPPPGRDRFLSLFRGLDWALVGEILTIKVLLFIFGVMSFNVLGNQPVGDNLGWLKIWNRWDSLSYQSLAQHGYQAVGEARTQLAFFPLFPWLTRLFSYVFSDYLLSAVIVSGLASIAAGLLLLQLARLDLPDNLARRAVFFLFIFPTSYFLHIGYTESLFLALCLGCFFAARTDRWGWVGILGFLAGLTRINSLVLVPGLAVEVYQRYRETRRWRWEWCLILTVVVGFAGYLLLNFYVTGDALAFLKIQQEHWFKSLTWPWVGIKDAWGLFEASKPTDSQMVGLQEFLFAALGLICTIWSWKKLRPSYSVWMSLNWLLFTSTTFLLSVPRYTLVMFPLFILFSRSSERPLWNTVMTTWSLLFLALFSSLFAWGHWAF